MDNGIYVALSKQIGIFRDMEVTANNLANMTTTGHGGQSLLFKDYLVKGNRQEKTVAYANDIHTYRNTEQGPLATTNAPLDAAIEGKGYFVVQTPLGDRYTRNGNFKTDGNGTLVTSEGHPVVAEGGAKIAFDDTDRVVDIRDNGAVFVDGEERAKIKIVQFDNEQLLSKAGDTLYKTDTAPKNAENFVVHNGMLENSNVKPVTELTHMLYVSRSISNTITLMDTLHTLQRKASDTLAKTYG